MADADHTDEIWKPIPFAPAYAASSFGRVKRLVPYHRPAGYHGLLRPLRRGRSGHLKVALSIDGKATHHGIHRLVAAAFIGEPPESRPMVCHKDGNPQNNRPENLYYGDSLMNEADKLRHGRVYCGSAHHSAKLTEEQVREIRRSSERGPVIARQLGVHPDLILLIRKRRIWKHVA